MRAWECDVCQHLVFFENTVCLTCGAELGFDADRGALVAFDPDQQRRCANATVAACNWLVPAWGPPEELCSSCLLTRTRPADGDSNGLAAFAKAETAKRRLVFQLSELGLPVVSRRKDPWHGLAFDLLASNTEPVSTGHADGLITLDLDESDDAYREATRVQLGEPYRTLLGHFRHEIGHYYWMLLIDGGPHLEAFRGLFGDDREDYGAAIERHYAGSPGQDWCDSFVSAYATMHPWEDWAETFAHYLHIRDTLQTAAAYGVLVTGPIDDRHGRRDLDLAAVPTEADRHQGREAFSTIIGAWLPFTYALNAVNRSMGRDDLYPFVLAPGVLEKLEFVHDRVTEAATAT